MAAVAAHELGRDGEPWTDIGAAWPVSTEMPRFELLLLQSAASRVDRRPVRGAIPSCAGQTVRLCGRLKTETSSAKPTLAAARKPNLDDEKSPNLALGWLCHSRPTHGPRRVCLSLPGGG